jgi:hypothetical protein
MACLPVSPPGLSKPAGANSGANGVSPPADHHVSLALTIGKETVNGQRYPGAVVLQMGAPRGEPGVKLAASENGAGLGLSDGHRLPDGRSGGIQLNARDTASFVKVVDSQGRERVLRP